MRGGRQWLHTPTTFGKRTGMSSPEIRGIDAPAVTGWLAEHVDGVEPPFTFDLIAAGGSNLTFRVTDAAGLSVALRRPPVGHLLATAHDMHREWRIMAALGEHSAVPVPPCLAYCEDTSVNGAPFYVMGFVEGLILRDRTSATGMTPEQCRQATESLVDVQVGFHTVDLDAVGLADLGKHDGYVARQLKRWRRQVVTGGVRELVLHADLFDRLSAAIPPERARPALAHGDYRFDNTVLGPDFGVIAVLDWELCTTGDPIADFAWSLQYWADPGDDLTFLNDPPTLLPAFMRRDEYLELYRQRSGFDLTDLAYYEAFSWWKQASIVEGAYARRLQGATGGMGSSGDPSGIAERVDRFLDHAHQLANAAGI